MRYKVRVMLTGTKEIDVDADSFEDAAQKAKMLAGATDYNTFENIEFYALEAEDKDGEYEPLYEWP